MVEANQVENCVSWVNYCGLQSLFENYLKLTIFWDIFFIEIT